MQRVLSTLICSAILLGEFVAGSICAQEAAKPTLQESTLAPSAEKPGFSGVWESTFGILELKKDGERFRGNYGGLGTIEGELKNGKLIFTYQEKDASGSGFFELAEDGQSFSGRWRENGLDGKMRDWSGKRFLGSNNYSGIWETTFGRMRISEKDGQVEGAYSFEGTVAPIKGTLKGNRLDFTYEEPGGVTGEAWFRFRKDGMSFEGFYRPKGGQRWSIWTGTRIRPVEGRVWFVVLEANWERGLGEPQYAFGEMLEQYFKMPSARHVQFRHRFFHDRADLSRFCRELRFLAEPVVLLISTHGSPEGIEVFGDTIHSKELAEDLSGATNVKLLHLSGCAMMASRFGHEVQTNAKGTNMAVSGYKTVVDWDASALADFTYLTLVLIHGYEPAKAVKKAIKLSPYLGDTVEKGSAFVPLGLAAIPPLEEMNLERKLRSPSPSTSN